MENDDLQFLLVKIENLKILINTIYGRSEINLTKDQISEILLLIENVKLEIQHSKNGIE
jgi:hypothetical protein